VARASPCCTRARRAECFNGGGRHAGEFLLSGCIVAQVLLLAGERLDALLQVAPPPLILVERDHRPEIGVGEPLELLAQVRLGPAQRLTARDRASGELDVSEPTQSRGSQTLMREPWLNCYSGSWAGPPA
jgi:hypothetical protein